jgi:ribosomal protein S18 acetylase RimI-like enzyme
MSHSSPSSKSYTPKCAKERTAALKCLLGPHHKDTAVAHLDALLQARGCAQDAIRMARAPTGELVVSVVVPGPGRVGVLLLSPLPGPVAAAAAAQAAADALSAVSPQQVHLIQALIRPDDTLRKASLEHAGLSDLAVLRTMDRLVPRPGPIAPDLGTVSLEPCLVGDECHVANLMVDTYQDTLDCPGLRGLRDPMDTLRGHLACGAPIPELWCIVHVDQREAGVLLVADQADVSDLVYVGLLPFARGRGVGRLLMNTMLFRLGARPQRRIRLSVDQANTHAVALYESLGFQTRTQSRALIATVGSVQVRPLN